MNSEKRWTVTRISSRFHSKFILLAASAFLCLGINPVAAATDDGQVPTQVSEPLAPLRGTVVMAHGTTQHAGSFATLAEQLNEAGFRVVAVDLRGHGKRFWRSKNGMESKVDYWKSSDDLIQVFQKYKRVEPDKPLFCIGESVGAAVATNAAGKAPSSLDGLILCSAGTRARVANFNPFLVVPDFLLGIWRLDHSMDVSRYILRYSADDRKISQEMVDDPLSRIKLTPREILKTGWFIGKTPELAKSVSEDLPVLIVQGNIDHIVSASSVKAILKNLPSKDKKIASFPTFGHVLLGTSYLKPPVVATVKDWLVEHSQEAPATAMEPRKQDQTPESTSESGGISSTKDSMELKSTALVPQQDPPSVISTHN